MPRVSTAPDKYGAAARANDYQSSHCAIFMAYSVGIIAVYLAQKCYNMCGKNYSSGCIPASVGRDSDWWKTKKSTHGLFSAGSGVYGIWDRKPKKTLLKTLR